MTIESTIKLNNEIEIPRLGLGTYLSQPGKDTQYACEFALDYGYRNIDTAAFYQNEEDVGKAVRNSSVPREKIFVTTKLWNADQGYESALKAFDESMKKLDIDYIDLYLIHWPLEEKRHDSWKALEKIYESGKARSIGVSNYTIDHIRQLLDRSEIVPVVNQVEFSPYLYQKELQDFGESHGIFIEAYTPLTRGKKLKDPKLIEIADKYHKTTAQILIKWALQVNTIVLPKSVHKDRIIENADIFDFDISGEDLNKLSEFNEDYRTSWDPSNIK
jgi:diketogulonate reductase-like aldo/keto reductase